MTLETPQEERRRNDSVVLVLVQAIHDDVKRIDAQLTAHISEEEDLLRDHTENLKKLHTAFPQDDVEGHRLYHASIIERNQWVAGLCKDITKEIAKYGLIGFLVWLGYQAWLGFLAGPHK